MSRAHPWISKCPAKVTERLQQLSSTRLYLMRETGPTSFIIQHEQSSANANSNSVSKCLKYKVRIGSTHQCSCPNTDSCPCIHLLYVFCKLFRIPESNPLIWQSSLIDHEINQILQGRASGTTKKKRTHKNSRFHRRNLEEGDVCPICQEDMVETNYLVHCSECGQNIHTKCMKIWCDHRTKCHENITCPLCRTEWTYSQIQQLSVGNRKRYVTSTAHVGVKCDGCSVVPIRGDRFKCSICAEYNLCSECFNYKSIHTQHAFNTKANPDDHDWLAIERTISSHPLSASTNGSANTSQPITSKHTRRAALRSRTTTSRSHQVQNSAREGIDLSIGGTTNNHHRSPSTRVRHTRTTHARQRSSSTPSIQMNTRLLRQTSQATSTSRQTSMHRLRQTSGTESLDPLLLALQHRDITENDYDLLLQLDSPKNNGLPKHIFSVLPQVHVNEQNYPDFSDESCSICLSNYQVGDHLCHLKCMHYYHHSCISKWFETHDSCCVCNHKVQKEEHAPPSRPSYPIDTAADSTQNSIQERTELPASNLTRSTVPTQVHQSQEHDHAQHQPQGQHGNDINLGITGAPLQSKRRQRSEPLRRIQRNRCSKPKRRSSRSSTLQDTTKGQTSTCQLNALFNVRSASGGTVHQKANQSRDKRRSVHRKAQKTTGSRVTIREQSGTPSNVSSNSTFSLVGHGI